MTATGSRIAVAGMTWLLAVGLARLLGTRAFGDYVALTAIVQVVAVVSDAGLNRVIVRDVAVDPSLAAPYARTVRRARLALSLLAVLLGIALAGFAGTFGGVALATAVLGLVPLADARTSEGLMYASGRIPTAAGVAAIYAFVRLFLSLTAATLGAGVVGVMAAHSIAAALYALLMRRAVGSQAESGNMLPARTLFRLSYPFAVLIGLEALYARLDVFIIVVLTNSPVLVGLYGAAYKLFEAANVPSSAVGSVLVPEYARRLSRRDPSLPSTVRRAVLGSMFVGLALAVVVVPMAPQIVTMIYGPSYASAAGALAWLAVAAIAGFGVYPLSALLAASRLQGSVLAWSVLQVAVNAVANLFLVTHYGITGAGAAMALTTVAGIVFYGALSAHLIGAPLRATT